MGVTRRGFVAGGLAYAALAGSGCAEAPNELGPFDVCVIGSGFAGTFLGLRTTARGLRTIVVEAGPDPREGRLLPAFENSGEISYPVNQTRVMALGGTSNHWTGMVNRMRPNDFRVRSQFSADVDWPFGYDELAPYYCQAEEALAVRGYSPISHVEPPRSCEYPFSLGGFYQMPELRVGDRSLRFFGVATSRRLGAPPRLIEDEIPRFTRSPHATLLSNWPVTRLVTLDGRTIDHVLARSPGGGAKKIQARVFVVAAGVVESARLLLLSRSRWFAEGLGNGSGWVGTRLVAHRSVYWTFAREDVTLVPRGIHRTYDFHDDSRRKRMSAYHYQLDVRERLVRWKLQPEMEPRAENRVTLSSTLDAFGDSTTRVSLGYSERDRRTIGHGQILLDELAGRLNKDRGSPNRREKWRAHPSGTCRMGFDESGGVVDQHQKVFGVDNLYVSGASVFPTAGTANPTLTVVALTFRLADHLLAQLSVSGS